MSADSGASWAWRLLGGTGAVLALLGFAALGWLWHLDRARAWETPALGPPLVLLRGPAAARDAATWLVAVNPDCHHCREVLRDLAARSPDCVRVGALVVDTPGRPGRSTLARLPGAPIWWDAKQVWRRRWGHRVYGEVIRFDPRGRYSSTRLQPPGSMSLPLPSAPAAKPPVGARRR
jgi:hypothetical protein